MIVAALLLCLPMVGEGQSIRHHPESGGGKAFAAAAPGTTTTGTVEEVLYSIVMPAGSLNSVGDVLFVVVKFSTAANGNSKIGRIRFGAGTGGTSVSSVTTTTSAAVVQLYLTCIMDSSSTVACNATNINGATASILGSVVTGLDFTGAITLSVNGTTGTGAGEITLNAVSATVLVN